MIVEENGVFRVECGDDGMISIKRKEKAGAYFFKLFYENYQYLRKQWAVETRMFFTLDLNYLIVTYGIGYVYTIDLNSMELVRSWKLFQDISYEDDSYQNIDLCCYYNEATEVDFSPWGRYAILRVRGDYDPQEGDGRTEIFTPVYFSSVFLVDLQTLELVFQYDSSDMQERYSEKNVAVAAMDSSEKKLLVGALGNDLKLFDVSEGCEIGTFKKLAWIPDPLDIRKCQLAVFMDENRFAYVNEAYNIAVVVKQADERWLCGSVIDTGYEMSDNGAMRKRRIRCLEYDQCTGEFVCDSELRFKCGIT